MNIKPQLMVSPHASSNTMQDVMTWIAHEPLWSDLTTKDYVSQVNRCIKLFNVNSLEDIPANIEIFENRFPRKWFPAEQFKSYPAFLAWRKKMISVLKHFLGVMTSERERRSRNDKWAELIATAEESDFVVKLQGIAIGVLASEARMVGVEPKDLTQDWLAHLCRSLPLNRSNSVHRAIRYLDFAGKQSNTVAGLLPKHTIDVDQIVRRTANPKLPFHVEDQARIWIDEICSGDFDEILEEYSGSLSKSTYDSFMAAMRKYIGSAVRSGSYDLDCLDITLVFTRPVFLAVMREWISETDPSRMICDRTKHAYVSRITQVAAHACMPTDFMHHALGCNKNLKQGFSDAKEMPENTKNFCKRLLRDRTAEMRFQSLHIALFRETKRLISNGPVSDLQDTRINRLGMLAAFAAIALWGVPLRIGNLRTLRHRGENPTLVLPLQSRRRAYILIPSIQVKNGKAIKAHISGGPTRALEIIEWYIAVIRPRLPMAATSTFLFPGYQSELISSTTLRNALFNYTRDMGIPMNPHNFRHGLATLYLRDHPGEYSQAARLLGNTAATVRQHYAWIDEEAELARVQKEVAIQAGFHNGT